MASSIEQLIVDTCSTGPLSFFARLKGPEFLVLYLVLFLILRCSIWYLRGSSNAVYGRQDYHLLPTVLAFLLFELFGLVRYLVGSAHGMQRWDFLFIMMAVGGIIFFSKGDFLDRMSSGRSSGSSYYSGSGCGGGGCGGGCGGGGCGGCGGS